MFSSTQAQSAAVLKKENGAERIGFGGQSVADRLRSMSFASVADMAAITVAQAQALDGLVVNTSSFHAAKGYGAAPYRIRALAEYRTEIGDAAWSPDGFGDHSVADGSYVALLIHNGVVFPEQFGWLGDCDTSTGSGTDNTDCINAMIEWCCPYQWLGSVTATKAAYGTPRAKIFGGHGNAKVTNSIKINPFMKWEGMKPGGFFGYNGGTQIVACFTDKTKYTADTAPMDDTGARPLGATYQKGAWDGGTNCGCPGFTLKNVGFGVAVGFTVKGIFNRQIAIQSHITECRIGGGAGEAYEGIKNSVVWGGSIRDCHVVARAYGIRNENDITTDDQENNYISIIGTKPTSTDYTYVSWPNADLQGKSACMVNVYADPHLDDNTYEGAEIGIAATNGTYLRDNNGYFEKIKEYVYACHSVDMDCRPKWLLCDLAQLFYVRGASTQNYRIDLGGCSYFTVAGFGLRESFTSRPRIIGRTQAFSLPYSASVVYQDATEANTIDIYVSSSGDDANSGYLTTRKVQTLQGALDRCLPGVVNNIVLTNGETIATRYALGSGNTTNTQLENLAIKITGTATIAVSNSSGQTHCIPTRNSSIILDGPTISMAGAGTSGDYRSFFRAFGANHYTLRNATVTGSNGALFGNQFSAAGHANITLNTVTLGSGVVFTQSGASGAFSWIESSAQVTNSGAVVGSATAGRIYSATFP